MASYTGPKPTAMNLSRRALLTAALPALAITAARAQSAGQDAETYPDHQVTFIVPFAPGGSTDTLARLLAERLQQRLGKPFVVENRPGAGTVLATNFVAKSPADGYTIMMAVSSLAIDATLYKSLPYDPGKDLALAALVATVPFVLVVNPSLQVYDVADLIKLAKERPLSYGSGGIGAFHHLAAALFSSMAGIKMQHVPYRGTAPALNDLMGGYIQLMFSRHERRLAADQCRKSPRARGDHQATGRGAAGRAAARRSRRAGLRRRRLARRDRAGSDAAELVLAKLNSEINAIVTADDIRARLKGLGLIPVGTGSVPELQKFLQSEIVRWGKVVTDAGIAGTE